MADHGIYAEPDPVKCDQMSDIDPQLGMTTEVPDVQAIEVEAEQAQTLGDPCAHGFPFRIGDGFNIRPRATGSTLNSGRLSTSVIVLQD